MASRKSTGGETGKVGAQQSAAASEPAPYVVLARKYRPETFEQLIGQQAMVQTLKNAFAADRIAQGYMLTGVRGVGKTTTARILARALNFSKPGAPDKPTVALVGYGEHCPEIIASRHPDVIEMDAASNTGVDNMREIIESARYKPLVARYKVFIIDEVHMLSKGAFNALLKTLEEPPAHVKFIFATTEVRKVPVTVLSRCQRFDLRRVGVPELVEHFARIVGQEGANAEPEALALIARASEGSVRDGLSILDQAIAMGAGSVGAAEVRAMLGLADRGRIFDLLEHVLAGRAGEALTAIAELHRDGAEPVQILADLADAVHAATRTKLAGGDAGEALSAEERRRATTLGERLSIPLLSRAWQMLLKGLDEAGRAPDPMAAAEMVLVRLAFTSDLPAPDEIIRALRGQGVGQRAAGSPQQPPRTEPTRPAGPLNQSETPRPLAGATERSDDEEADDREPDDATGPVVPFLDPMPRSFEEVVALAGEKRDAKLRLHLEDHVSLVRFEPERIELCLLAGAPPALANELSEKLGRWTGRRWVVAISREAGARPLGDVRREREAAELTEIKSHPAVKAVLECFPEAEIKEVQPLEKLDGRDDDSAVG